MKMKKWSSRWTQFMQLRKETWKKIQDFNEVWTRDLAIPVRCSTNRAMKPLTLGAGQLWVHMFPWKKWVLMIYEINHIWTAEMKWRWRNDRRSERNLCNCVKNLRISSAMAQPFFLPRPAQDFAFGATEERIWFRRFCVFCFRFTLI